MRVTLAAERSGKFMIFDFGNACAIASASFAGVAFAEWASHRRDNRILRDCLRTIFGSGWNGRIETRDQLLAIRRFLDDSVRPADQSEANDRPFLRHSVTEILARKRGFCGENARVAIRLLNHAGVRTRRIYLWSKSWGHVAAESHWEGRWTLFDAYGETDFFVPDAAIGTIGSEDFERFPNQTAENPWIAFHRLKFLRRVPFVSKYSRVKLPYPVCDLVESPAAIRGFLAASLSWILAVMAIAI